MTKTFKTCTKSAPCGTAFTVLFVHVMALDDCIALISGCACLVHFRLIALLGYMFGMFLHIFDLDIKY